MGVCSERKDATYVVWFCLCCHGVSQIHKDLLIQNNKLNNKEKPGVLITLATVCIPGCCVKLHCAGKYAGVVVVSTFIVMITLNSSQDKH